MALSKVVATDALATARSGRADRAKRHFVACVRRVVDRGGSELPNLEAAEITYL